MGYNVFRAQLRIPTGGSAHQAVAQAQRYVAEGYNIVVDLDLEKFFDRVNHDGLMARVAARISNKRVLKLIWALLTAGVMEDGLVLPVTPQGGPLSPLLSNLMLDDLDRELTRRSHRFYRYAVDCNIYIRSHRAGERVMTSVSQFLTTKLRLTANEAKSAVALPEERKFLGFSISNDGAERRIAPKALDTFKTRVREQICRTRGLSLTQMLGNSRHTLSVGAATSASAELLACLRTSKRGPAEDCAHIFGGSGGMGTTASTNCAAVACHSSEQRLRPVQRPASGVCQHTRRSKRPCATTTLIHLASPDSTFRTRLNPVEPPWYETRMPGGVGGAAPNGAPLYPDQSLHGHKIHANLQTTH